MDLLSVFLIALGLSADCFAVALSGSVSMLKVSHFQVFRTSLAFGFSQFLMPVIGWVVGRSIVHIISAYDHWVAFSLLALVGGHMLWESFRGDGQKAGTDITRGVVLLTLAVATSIDALAIGLSFAVLDGGIMWASATIGLVAFAVTGGGFWLGRKAGSLLGKRAKTVGGIILIGIGVRILLTHLL